MVKLKLFISSGCSFSECLVAYTWPRFLEKHLQCEVDHKAMGSQGNGMISRGVIYAVTQALKKYKPKEILVGVMWSGPDRHEYYKNDADKLVYFTKPKYYQGWMENPTNFIPNASKNWIIMNHSWVKIPEIRQYYEDYWDETYSQIQTYEHILRLQWFLKLNNIKYFFSRYVGDDTIADKFKDHPDIKHLYEQIDFNQFLPVPSIYDWVVKNKIDEDHWKKLRADDTHPSPIQHEAFVNRVIIPWLLDKKYI